MSRSGSGDQTRRPAPDGLWRAVGWIFSGATMNTSRDGRAVRTSLLGLALCVATSGVVSDAIAGAVDQGRWNDLNMPEARRLLAPSENPVDEAKARKEQE